ncbi:MAG TPA: energy transducer TonB [Bacteroidia bacterium]|jgi:hypothetical protein
MRKFLSSAFIFLIISNLSAQDDALTHAEQMPSFPGGEPALYQYLHDKIKYPTAEKEAGVSGKCYVSFVVEIDSTISQVKILKGVTNGPGCDIEAMCVVSGMPKWIPGKQNGKPVRVQFVLPVKFTLQSKKVPAGTGPDFGRRCNSASLTDTMFLSASSVRCARAEADFYRIAAEQDGAYLIKEMDFKTNLPQGIFMSNSLDSLVKNGKGSNYVNGKKSSEGNYENDKQKDVWTIWRKGVRDSLVVNCRVDGTYENIYIPVDYAFNTKYKTWYPIVVMPQYPGGEKEMMSFIQQNVRYPSFEKNHLIIGTCYVTFVVEKNGTLTDVRVLKA